MPTIYVGNDLSKTFPFADFNPPKLGICSNFQKKHSNGENNFVGAMEFLSNAHDIREINFGDLPQIWK